MLNTILGALFPMVVTFLLGFVAAWRHDFGTREASILNRMVLLYAVPSPSASHLSILAAKTAETVKEPIVWAPVLGFVVVRCGLHIPHLIVHSLSILRYASGGVSLFVSGIVLASYRITVNWRVLFFAFLKNIVRPAWSSVV